MEESTLTLSLISTMDKICLLFVSITISMVDKQAYVAVSMDTHNHPPSLCHRGSCCSATQPELLLATCWRHALRVPQYWMISSDYLACCFLSHTMQAIENLCMSLHLPNEGPHVPQQNELNLVDSPFCLPLSPPPLLPPYFLS